MRIYLKNIPAKFHPNPIRNNRALGVFKECCLNKNKKNNKMSSDTRSVHDPKLPKQIMLLILSREYRPQTTRKLSGYSFPFVCGFEGGRGRSQSVRYWTTSLQGLVPSSLLACSCTQKHSAFNLMIVKLFLRLSITEILIPCIP